MGHRKAQRKPKKGSVAGRAAPKGVGFGDCETPRHAR